MEEIKKIITLTLPAKFKRKDHFLSYSTAFCQDTKNTDVRETNTKCYNTVFHKILFNFAFCALL